MGEPTASDESRHDELARLRSVVERARPVSTADQRVLPVLDVLADLLPGGGLRRGSLVQVDGVVGATSLALAVSAGPTRAGSWVACVGVDQMGWSAAVEAGVDLDRLVAVRATSPTWATVTAALVDAFDVVVCTLEHAPSATEARRLQARARERGAVLVVVRCHRGAVGGGRRPWPGVADLALTVVDARWQGLGQGWGNLRSRRVTIEVSGRRGADRPRRVELLLPGPTGAPAAVPAAGAPAADGSAAPAPPGDGVVALRRTG